MSLFHYYISLPLNLLGDSFLRKEIRTKVKVNKPIWIYQKNKDEKLKIKQKTKKFVEKEKENEDKKDIKNLIKFNGTSFEKDEQEEEIRLKNKGSGIRRLSNSCEATLKEEMKKLKLEKERKVKLSSKFQAILLENICFQETYIIEEYNEFIIDNGEDNDNNKIVFYWNDDLCFIETKISMFDTIKSIYTTIITDKPPYIFLID
jgi:hypothetical protein